MLYVLGRCFAALTSENDKVPNSRSAHTVGVFGTCCFRMPLLFRCDFYPSRGEAETNSAGREVLYKTASEPLSPGIIFCTPPPLSLPAERFLTPSSARIREDAKAHRSESPFSPLYRLPFCECEKRSAERSESRGEAFGRMLRLSSDRCHPARKNPYRGFCP